MSNGYIYCVSTPANNDRCKVGETLKGIEHRLKGLNTTNVSENFKLDYYIVVDPKKRFNIETSIHNEIINDGYTRFTGKEFFKCNPNDIKHIFEKYGKIYYKINEHIIENNEEETNINENIKKDTNINENIDKSNIKKLRKCENCKKIFDRKSTYDFHIRRKNSCTKEITENKCSNCNIIFSTKYNLSVHIISCKQKIIKSDLLTELKTFIIDTIDIQSKFYNNIIDMLIEKNNKLLNYININNISQDNLNDNISDQQSDITCEITDFNTERLSDLSIDEFKIICSSKDNYPLKYIELIHCNDRLKKYNNIKYTNILENNIYVYTCGEWEVIHINDFIDKIHLIMNKNIIDYIKYLKMSINELSINIDELLSSNIINYIAKTKILCNKKNKIKILLYNYYKNNVEKLLTY